MTELDPHKDSLHDKAWLQDDPDPIPHEVLQDKTVLQDEIEQERNTSIPIEEAEK